MPAPDAWSPDPPRSAAGKAPATRARSVAPTSEPAPRLADAFHVLDAAPAQLRVVRMRADIIAVVPATHTLRCRARHRRHPGLRTLEFRALDVRSPVRIGPG